MKTLVKLTNSVTNTININKKWKLWTRFLWQLTQRFLKEC